ncbi:NAD-dependent epimerase/dehydratase family protein [Falsibacillus albus]|uniref:NAD-dependent epimerase/dehydratase family protein n=1 Tax=Falsibacillus albus TaxID=2478915 RepID=UPI001314728B|nr:NAD-dependent epimerase/dehydratase family protein [Falsibacillus albus]
MNILIIGGTKFVGRSIAAEALERNHDVTLFNRGITNPDAFPEVPVMIGNRDNVNDLEQIARSHWDVIIDTCGYQPHSVQKAMDILRNSTGKYVFISTCSVYKDAFKATGVTEESETLKLSEGDESRLHEEGSLPVERYYGELKQLCECEVMNTFGKDALIIRPGLIVGPYDPSDRFTYWVERISRGGSTLVPDNLDCLIQFIDVRDLASWVFTMIEESLNGIWNVVGPTEPLRFGDFLTECKQTLNSHAEFVQVSDQFLLENEVQPWMELPLWIPQINSYGLDIRKVKEFGLKTRPLKETIKETYEWASSRDQELKRNAGLDKEKEKRLLNLRVNSH